MVLLNILTIFILIALNAFFVCVEYAVVASRRARLDVLAETDSKALRLVHAWLEQPAERDRLIAANQIAITIISLALGAVGENTFAELLDPIFANLHPTGWLHFLGSILPALPLTLSLIVVTTFHVVLGEQVPKVAVLRSPERFALFSAPVMNIFSKVFKAFIDLLYWLTRVVLRIIGVPTSGELNPYSLEELKEMVTGPEMQGVIEQPEREMLSAVIDFGELVVRQVIVPRTEIFAVQADETVSAALQMTVENGITKLPMYEENLDQIIGLVHLRDLVRELQAGHGDQPVRELRRDGLFVPETISVNDLMREFRDHHTHMAIVLDEFGGTSGLVTLENLMEEIVGEVLDPFDTAPPEIQTLPDGTMLVDGLMLIDEVNEHFGLNLSDPHYDTIAGYVLGRLGRIPKEGDEVDDHEQNVRLKVVRMDRLRIDRVAVSHL